VEGLSLSPDPLTDVSFFISIRPSIKSTTAFCSNLSITDNLTFMPIHPLPYQATIQALSCVLRFFPETNPLAFANQDTLHPLP